jgi:DNA-binding CsgD family transcriptional regulator
MSHRPALARERPRAAQVRHPPEELDPRFRGILTAILGSIATLGAIDLVLDEPASPFAPHVLFEVGFVTLSLGAILYLWRGWRGAQDRLAGSRRALRDREDERDRWREKATRLLHGLGVEIEAQFARWGLTPAEKQVALLLLKGLGHKEAAHVLDRSERTIRQHAVAVYRKSGLAGRAELAAFFLEDLLLPQDIAIPSASVDAEGVEDDTTPALGRVERSGS